MSTPVILVVEDDPVLRLVTQKQGEMLGYAVQLVESGEKAVEYDKAGICLIFMDIGLPGMDGFEVVRRLRARGSNMPVLLLTARDTVADRVHGLELGADDYLVKPFATPELVARIKALIRRSTPQPTQLTVGALSLDTAAKRATIEGRKVDFSVREWTVLEYLMQQASRVVSKQQIIDAVLPWGEDVTLNAVEVYVSRIRTKTAGSGVAIRTIRGFGYMLEKATTEG